MKTVCEWYQLLPQPFMDQAIRNHEDQRHLSNVAKSASSLEGAIEHGFIWGQSKEGIPHWNTIYNAIPILLKITEHDAQSKK